jgi:hypothetical protein
VKTSIGISRLEAGRHRVDEGDEEKRQRVSRRGEGDEADRRAPHGSDVREKASLPECAKSKEIHISTNTLKLLGPNGLSEDPAAWGVKQASAGGAGPDGPKYEVNSFSNKN